MAKAKAAPVNAAQVAAPFKSLAQQARAAVDFAAGLSPNGRALAFQANMNANGGQGGLAGADPAMQQAIQELAAQMDAEQAAGQGAPTMFTGGDIAELTGRMPSVMGSANWGSGVVTPEQQEVLSRLAQPVDPAGAFGSPSEAAKWANMPPMMQPQVSDAFDDPMQVAIANATNQRGPGNVAEAMARVTPEAQAQRAATFNQAQKNVGLMSAAGAIARKQALGIIPAGVDPQSLLAAVAPSGVQDIIAPEAIALRRQAANQAEATRTGAKTAVDVAEIEAKTRQANTEAVATAEKNRMDLERERDKTRAEVVKLEQQRQAAADARAVATTQREADAHAKEMEAKALEIEAKKKQMADYDRLAPIRQKESEKAAKALDRDNYSEFQDDPVGKAEAMVGDLQAMHSGVDLNGKSLEKMPPTIKQFLRHARQHFRTLSPTASYLSTDETDFEDYVVQQLSGVGGMSPGTLRVLAEQFYESN
jgi:hypothetical protein